MDQTQTTVIGTLELEKNGSGRLRDAAVHYRIRPVDPAVPDKLCRAAGLRGGETVEAVLRNGQGSGKPGAQVAEIVSVDGMTPGARMERKPFDELTAIDPRRRLTFETPGGPLPMRIIDLLTPIGLGQRGLIVAPPRTGKTVLLQQMAHAVAENFPDCYMIVLLIDERPEEVTEMRRNVRGEVIASSNDEDTASHVRLARLVISKAKRMVEAGRDVVMLLDSLTRVGRAFNAAVRTSGRTMSGGLDVRALAEPKSIFGAARNVENGGSLTIIASALIETGSRMDEVIFNEFKGTGNMEIMLNREMANRRLWPAIDLPSSGTRKEDLLLTPAELAVSHHIRRKLIGREPVRSMETLLESMTKYPTNAAFVKAFSEQTIR
jgi:transcription termination factor Rho